MDESERRDTGLKVRRRVLGDAHVERALAQDAPLTAEFQDLITRYAWGEIWTRPGLDERARRILVLGTLIALGRFDEFRMHARAAMSQGGFSENDLKEIVLQQAIYCGVPAANTAFEVLREITKFTSEETE
ncbi:MAG: carboxymuconolactone decarboxylase family protein [Acidobacteriota bacterium]|nr:carboxymuconolactone decarboxylase family protein [Acidobacteriota bacterium]